MRTRASLGGHPVHPMLVVIPLGALPTALVFDALQVAWAPLDWRPAALVASIVGTLGIAAAVVPGLVDYRWSVPKRGAVRAVARGHMALGLSLLGYFALVTLARGAALAEGSAGAAGAAWAVLLASAVGNLGLLAQGYLGGELRARHRLGVDSAVPEAMTSPERDARGPPEEPERPRRGPYGGGGAPGAP